MTDGRNQDRFPAGRGLVAARIADGSTYGLSGSFEDHLLHYVEAETIAPPVD